MASSLAALMQGPAVAKASAQNYGMRILTAPASGDEARFQTAFHQNAQQLSDRLFTSLASLLGGTAPALNFVAANSPLTPSHFSANVTDAPGGPKGTINLDPAAVDALIQFKAPFHNSAVNNMPHEMAHLHQTPATLADLMQREGGAQAFTDLVTPTAAKRAHIPYDATGNYDGPYADYVQQIQARPDARSFILGSQFGRTAPSAWP